jgi:hypothetical protein
MYLKCIYLKYALLHSKRIHVFYTYPKRFQDTFWDTYQIHQDICILHVGYMRDTCGIHMRYMYLQRFEDTLRIHAGYMRDT